MKNESFTLYEFLYDTLKMSLKFFVFVFFFPTRLDFSVVLDPIDNHSMDKYSLNIL